MELRKVILPFAGLVLFATLTSTLPVLGHAAAQSEQSHGEHNQKSQHQSASGKIVSVTGNNFSIEVRKGDDVQTLEFVTDSKTAVDGKLAVGSDATVEYRTDNGRNLAVRINVPSAS